MPALPPGEIRHRRSYSRCRCPGNRRLIDMYEALNAHIKIARIHGAEANWQARVHQEEAEHEAIVKAIEARDAAALCAALRSHIYRAKDVLVASVRQREEQQNGK